MTSLGQGAVPFGVYPWEWARDEVPMFRKLRSGAAGLLCAPILQALILNRFPDELDEWVARVSRLKFKRIIPCHFANNIRASPSDFASAFDFIHEGVADSTNSQSKVARRTAAASPTGLRSLRPRRFASTAPVMDASNEDFMLLLNASEICTRLGITDAPLAGPLVNSY